MDVKDPYGFLLGHDDPKTWISNSKITNDHGIEDWTMTYNISEAKENIDLILDLAESGHPQVIKRRNKEVAVIVSVEEWKRMSDRAALTEKGAAGMTVNERLYLSGLLEPFDRALAKNDKPAARAILEQIYLTPENIEAILLNEFK